MISTVYTPDGITISTLDYDIFYNSRNKGGEDYVETLNIVGHPHVISFWDRYGLVFHQVDEYRYNAGLKHLLEEVMQHWSNEIPPIYDFMPYIKKKIVDCGLNLIGIMGGYSRSKSSVIEPYVYQILGTDIRRININSAGEINYNCVFLEKETCFGRLLRDVRIKNGEDWVDLPPVNIRCDLFSIDKALNLSKFILTTSEYLNNINSTIYSDYRVESAIITPDKLSIVKI